MLPDAPITVAVADMCPADIRAVPHGRAVSLESRLLADGLWLAADLPDEVIDRRLAEHPEATVCVFTVRATGRSAIGRVGALLAVAERHGFAPADLRTAAERSAEPVSADRLIFERVPADRSSEEALRHALVLDACGADVRAQTAIAGLAASESQYAGLASGAYLRAARIGGFAPITPVATFCRAARGEAPVAARDRARYPILISIHLQTNNPENFVKFCDRLANSCDDPTRVEVVVKIDDDHVALNDLLPREVARQPFRLKFISTPLVGGFFALWESMNDMLEITDPGAYFLLNVNDEMYFLDRGWDSRLERYVGLFPDDLYRLRTSVYKHRNYHDHWECGFAPETSAITTKRWILTGGNWNPCLGPDTFQQCVAYYFSLLNRHLPVPRYREIPVDDIRFGGEGAYIGLTGKALRRRVRGATRAWFRLMSPEIQQEAARRAAKLHATIAAAESGLGDEAIVTDRKHRVVSMVEGNRVVAAYSFAIPRWGYYWLNLYRVTQFPALGGGGQHARSNPIRVTLTFLALRYDWADRLRDWMYEEAVPRLMGRVMPDNPMLRLIRRCLRIVWFVLFHWDRARPLIRERLGQKLARLPGFADRQSLAKRSDCSTASSEQLKR